MSGCLGIQQLREAPTLPRVRRERLDCPDVGDDIDQRAADFGGTVGIGAVARRAALSEKREGAYRHQHKQTESDDQTPPDSREDNQCRTEIGAHRGDVEQNDRQRLLYRIPGRRDPAGERAAQQIGEIAAGMAAQMVEQIELGLRLVDKHGTIAEPAAETPEHALSRQQTCEHRERPPRRGDMIGALSHRIDDQLQAVLRGAGTEGRPQHRGERSEVQERPPPDVVPEKRNRSARKRGDTACARAVGGLGIRKPQRSGQNRPSSTRFDGAARFALTSIIGRRP